MGSNRKTVSAPDSTAVDQAEQLLHNPRTGPRLKLGFFIFGLLNNLSYVVMLSAAKDIVNGGLVSQVLLAADVPALCAQFFAPFFLSSMSYSRKIAAVVFMTVASYLVVAEAPSVNIKLAGVMITSVCFGLGESTFLALCANLSGFSKDTVSLYSSGTGAAGLAGSGLYLLLCAFVAPTSALRLMCVLPPALLYAYIYLIAPVLKARAVQDDEAATTTNLERNAASGSTSAGHGDGGSASGPSQAAKWRYLPRLLRYYLPLVCIYITTFSLNHSLLPYVTFSDRGTGAAAAKSIDDGGDGRVLGDDLQVGAESSDKGHTQEYVVYFFVYQLGVFLSRSSLSLIKVPNLWLPTGLQVVNYLLILSHLVARAGSVDGSYQSLVQFPNLFSVAAVVFWYVYDQNCSSRAPLHNMLIRVLCQCRVCAGVVSCAARPT